MPNMFRSVLPNSNNLFFDHFNQASENACVMANLLVEAITIGDEQKLQFTQINRLRAKSQEITRQLINDSGKTFISPFERSDMFELVKALDAVASLINISSRRINLYQPATITPAIKELAELIVKASCELAACVKTLNDITNTKAIADAITNVKTLEHRADKVYNNAIAELLTSETDAIELIKYNEILLALETTADKCEHATNVIESIVVKNG